MALHEDDNFRIYVYRVPESLVADATSGRVTASQAAAICASGETRVQRGVTSAILTGGWRVPPLTRLPPSMHLNPPPISSAGASAPSHQRQRQQHQQQRQSIDNHPSVRTSSSSSRSPPPSSSKTPVPRRQRCHHFREDDSDTEDEESAIPDSRHHHEDDDDDEDREVNRRPDKKTGSRPAASHSSSHSNPSISQPHHSATGTSSANKSPVSRSHVTRDSPPVRGSLACNISAARNLVPDNEPIEDEDDAVSDFFSSPESPDPSQKVGAHQEDRGKGEPVNGLLSSSSSTSEQKKEQEMRLRDRNQDRDAGPAAASSVSHPNNDTRHKNKKTKNTTAASASDTSAAVNNKVKKNVSREPDKRTDGPIVDEEKDEALSSSFEDDDEDEFLSCSTDSDTNGLRKKEKKLKKKKQRKKEEDGSLGGEGMPVFEEQDSDGDDLPHGVRLSSVTAPNADLRVSSDDEDDLRTQLVNDTDPSDKKDKKKEEKITNGVIDDVILSGDEDEAVESSPKKRKRLFSSSEDSAPDEPSLLSDASTEELPTGDDSDDPDRKKNKKKQKSKTKPSNSKKKEDKDKDLNDKKKSEPKSESEPKASTSGTAKTKVDKKAAKSKDEKDSEKNSDSGDDSDCRPVPRRRVIRRVSSGDEYEPKKRGSDSDESDGKKGGKRKNKKKDSDEDDGEKKTKVKKKRRRTRVIELDSDGERSDTEEEEDEESDSAPKRKQKTPPKVAAKRILTINDFEKETQLANKAEKDRRARIAERQRLYNQLEQVAESGFENSSQEDRARRRLVLEYDEETREPIVEVAPVLAQQLKPHQINGIKFMYTSTIESIDMLENSKGSGCILAHSMGLGKTLQVITFVHTLLTNPQIKQQVKKVLVVCPKNTCRNWAQEFDYWLHRNYLTDFIVDDFDTVKTQGERMSLMRRWQKRGGVLIIGNNIFSKMTKQALTAKDPSFDKKRVGRPPNPKKKKKEDTAWVVAVYECLLVPGADLVIVDEGHLIKNPSTELSKTLSQIRTARRVILTGTPLQNNLYEYHTMIEFVKPRLLGNQKEFKQRFVNDIHAGQDPHSTDVDVRIMKRKVHVLHKLLEGCVQRCDYNVLVPYLQPKFEYVIKLRLTSVQQQVYRHYLDNYARNQKTGGGKGYLFNDCSILRLICCHPVLLRICHQREVERQEEAEFIDDGEDTPSKSSSDDDDDGSNGAQNPGPSTSRATKRVTRGSKKGQENGTADSPINLGSEAWFEEYFPPDIETDLALGAKIELLFNIIAECEKIGDKLIVFSQSLDTLNLIEKFLAFINRSHAGQNLFGKKNESLPEGEEEPLMNTWVLNVDYFRIDGQTAADRRKDIINKFNDRSNCRFRLILISTRAGSLGINLVGANRCIIFDASWNPTHDVQAIYRIYRFGQTKPCYIYRFLGHGTMEEKIYGRQIMKQALSGRVVDEHTIDSVFSENDLAELYKFEPEPENEVVPIVPKDRLFADILMSEKCKKLIVDYHMHDSLLEDRPEKNLTEEERNAAWQDYENEKEDAVRQEQQRLQREQAAREMAAERQRMQEQFLLQHQELLAQQQAQQAAAAGQTNGQIPPETMMRLAALLNPAVNGNPMPGPSNPPTTPHTYGRGRPPGSVNHDPEQVLNLTMRQVIDVVKIRKPNANLSTYFYELHQFINHQMDKLRQRKNTLNQKKANFPDFEERMKVVEHNIQVVQGLVDEYNIMYSQAKARLQKEVVAEAEEQRRRQLQQQIEHAAQLQETQRQLLQQQLDDPD